MGNLVAAGNEEKPGTSGSSVYRRPASDAESESKTPEVVPVVPVVVVNTRDVVDLADTLESCQTPDDRLAFAFYLLSANQVPDSQHSNCDVPVLEACTSFPIEEVVELIGAVLELKGDRFGCLYGQAATQFALHVCEILDGPSSSALTMAQLVDAYESSPFYEELLCY